jgi:Na+-transporting NADH:ubiquinone oxidoreductase subunit C
MPGRNSTAYSLFFAFIVSAIAGGLLLFAQNALSSRIETNERVDRIKSILAVLGLDTSKPASVLEQDFQNTLKRENLPDGNWRYEYKKDAEVSSYVYPIHGKGLWGPIEGFIALDAGLWKVVGITITRQEETPGLGSDIGERIFLNRFTSLPITATPQSNAITLRVRKAGTAIKGEVDGITGATETIKGFDKMLQDNLPAIVRHRRSDN